MGHAKAAPALGRADQSGVYQLEHGALAERMWNDFAAPALFAKQPLERVGGADRSPVGQRKAQMGDARFEVVLQVGQGRRGIAPATVE
jgi:hypothetical protein